MIFLNDSNDEFENENDYTLNFIRKILWGNESQKPGTFFPACVVLCWLIVTANQGT